MGLKYPQDDYLVYDVIYTYTHESLFVVHQVVEDGYEFFAKRQLVTLFSAPNYCGEFDNAGGMMSVDESLMCAFQVGFSNLCLLLCSCVPIWLSVFFCVIFFPFKTRQIINLVLFL